MQETARMADLNVSVNCVYNHKRELIDLTAGHVDDAWIKAVKSCYTAHDSMSAQMSDIVIVNAFPQADQDIDWWGAQASLKDGGTAVAIHRFQAGRALLHYRAEQMGGPWNRICGYPNRRWPVKQAGNILVYTDRISKRQMLSYDDNVEWFTEWNQILKRLETKHGNDALVSIYPYGKIQFDSNKHPLEI
jgi:nickel-dependent lactate racemase